MQRIVACFPGRQVINQTRRNITEYGTLGYVNMTVECVRK